MKICFYSCPGSTPGKQNVKDSRLDEVDKIVKAKKKTYIQVEIVGDDKALEADAIVVPVADKTVLVLQDLEFVETRLSRAADAKEQALLAKLKAVLEKDQLINSLPLTPDEVQAMASYNLLTVKPVIAAKPEEFDDMPALLARAVAEGGYLSFFTAGEKDTRAWLIKKGTTAVEAAGAIHTDIQKGFIRAEIIAYDDYIAAGGETPAKQAGKMRLEPKEYVMKDCDLANFRFNKQG